MISGIRRGGGKSSTSGSRMISGTRRVGGKSSTSGSRKTSLTRRGGGNSSTSGSKVRVGEGRPVGRGDVEGKGTTVLREDLTLCFKLSVLTKPPQPTAWRSVPTRPSR